MTLLPTLDEFRAAMLSAGYDEVLERPWPPRAVVPTHGHPFEADALVVAGEMWLTVGPGAPRHLRPGDRFHLQANEPHEECYGPQGATYWVARKAAAQPVR